MIRTNLTRFNVAVEVADFICYVKYIDKKNTVVPQTLVNNLYKLFQSNEQITKEDIANILELHIEKLTPTMFKEEKFNLCYNTLTECFINDEDGLSNTFDSHFVINMTTDLKKRFNKDEFMNYFTDIYRESLFLMDIRFYDIEKRYYEVPFEVYLTESEVVLESTNPIYVNMLLDKYSLNEIIDTLGIRYKPDFKGNIQTTQSSSDGRVEDLYAFNQENILELLVDSYDSNDCIFVNNIFLKSLNIKLEDLLTKQNLPKLLLVLEENEYSYFDKSSNSKVDRIEHHEQNTIVYISEHLFRECVGNSSYIAMMNNEYHVTINQLVQNDVKLLYLTKRVNKSLNLFNNILNKYFEYKRMNSYLDNLLLLTYTLEEDELNVNLNYYLANTLKSNDYSFLRVNLRESLPFSELKTLIQVYYLAEQQSKRIILNSANIKLLLNDMMNMIQKLSDLNSIIEFIGIIKEAFVIFNIKREEYETEITQIMTLINIKQIVISKNQEINFILDTSVLMDEPDLFHRYFNDKKVIMPSIVKDELENSRGNNINAVRAIRNINMVRNDPNYVFELINVENMVGDMKKPLKARILEDLIQKYSYDGKRSVLVSNDVNTELYKNNKENIIQTKHLPLLFNS